MSNYSKLDNFKILKNLGSGVSSKVKLGEDMNTGELVALKILRSQYKGYVGRLKAEYEIMRGLAH